jgi:hypothetical protein
MKTAGKGPRIFRGGRSCHVVIFVATVGTIGASTIVGPASDQRAVSQPSARAVLPQQLWTYRERDGVSPPESGILFCIVARPEDAGANTVIVASEDSLSPRAFVDFLTKRPKKDDPAILHVGQAPQREIAFHRMDIDGDNVDEVLLTGRGGAGGTSFLSVYQIKNQTVKLLFSDSSRFGFRIIDEDSDGQVEIANPGFEWVKGADSVLREKDFAIYRLGQGAFVESKRITAESFNRIKERTVERTGVPLSGKGDTPVLRVFDAGERKGGSRASP